jgi:hypothetical protein
MEKKIGKAEANVARTEKRRSTKAPVDKTVTLKFGGAVTGTLVGFSPDGSPLVDIPTSPAFAHLSARSCVCLDPVDIGKELVLLFDNGDPEKPLVMGIVQPPSSLPSPVLQVESAETLDFFRNCSERSSVGLDRNGETGVDMEVNEDFEYRTDPNHDRAVGTERSLLKAIEIDGKTLEFTGRESVTLRCGQASITLTEDGKILIRGTYLQSRSSGVNRIQGGSVQVN